MQEIGIFGVRNELSEALSREVILESNLSGEEKQKVFATKAKGTRIYE